MKTLFAILLLSIAASAQMTSSGTWITSGNPTATFGALQADSTLTPASLSFPSTQVGSSSAAQTITLKSVGSTTLTGIATTFSGANGSDYSISSTTCGSTLAVNATCTYSIVFTPSASGTRVGQISVSGNGDSSPSVTTFSGTATANSLAITTSAFPDASIGLFYFQPATGTGGTPPYTWSINSGDISACSLSLNGGTGVISGTPSATGTCSFVLKLADTVCSSACPTAPFTITVDSTPAFLQENGYCLPNETTAYPGGVTQDDGMDLPQFCVRTAVADTPSNSGVVNAVSAGNASGFQTALNTAACGDTITLVHGSVYTGSFTLPANSCDATHWITVRTDDLADLPPEGSRALPCQANVQLTNRPGYPGPGNCSSLVAAMPKLKGSGSLDETVRFSPGTTHVRFIGIEIEGKDVTRGTQNQNVINMQPATTNCGSNHLVFDRMWIHGIPDRSSVRAGLMGDGVCYVALINSSVTDIHCLAGVCTDSQIFQGGFGDFVKTAFKGWNNYTESAGTNSMSFGGGGATVMPTDLMWNRNYQYKPMSWNPRCVVSLQTVVPNGSTGTGYVVGDILTVIQGGASAGTIKVATVSGGVPLTYTVNAGGGGYAIANGLSTSGGTGTGALVNITAVNGVPSSCRLPDGTTVTYDGLGPYSVKNIFEIKNVIRALIEGNFMENNWMHADQAAFAILLTPKNQAQLSGGVFVGVCPGCIERHITVRYNHVLTSGGFFQIVNAGGDHGVGDATEGSHYTVHDNLGENLNYIGVINTGFSFGTYIVGQNGDQTATAGNPFLMHDQHIFHNTAVTVQPNIAMTLMDGPIGALYSNMVFRDNLFPYGSQGINQTSNNQCAGPTSTQFLTKYNNCWTAGYVHTKNAIVGGGTGYPGTWPAGNFFPATQSAVGYVNFNNAAYGDYRLCTAVGVPAPSCTGASTLHNAASDGKDVGADIPTMLNHTTGVSPWN